MGPLVVLRNASLPASEDNVVIKNFVPKKDMVKRPDVLVLQDPTKPPTQDNIKMIYEIKFGDDLFTEEQFTDYAEIAGDANKVTELNPCSGKNGCDCDQSQKEYQEQEDFSLEPSKNEVFLLSLLLAALVLDDLLPTGATQADDALIPGILARLAMAF